jgi:hypothetical protein
LAFPTRICYWDCLLRAVKVNSPDRNTNPSGNTTQENTMTTTSHLQFAGTRAESVLNSLLVAAMIGAVTWAAISPGLSSVLTRV